MLVHHKLLLLLSYFGLTTVATLFNTNQTNSNIILHP
jgi:hypothetical protein